jgi:large subunit ribosomal protein L5
MPRYREQYKNEIVGRMMEEFKYKNVMQVPRIEKIVLNMGLGEAIQDHKILEGAEEELTAIAGQKAVVTKARRSIAASSSVRVCPSG